MAKLLNKIKYKVKDASFAVAKGFSDAIVYYLYHYAPACTSKVLSDLPVELMYPAADLRQQLYRMHKKGHIGKITNKRKVSFVFNKAQRFAFLGDSLGRKAKAFQEGWDKKWRLVIYDIPDKYVVQRNRLRRELISLGFGKIQNSSWASCYNYGNDINEFCRQYQILDYICVYEGSFFAGKDEVKLVEDAWGLNQLNFDYKDLIEEVDAFIRELETKDIAVELAYRQYGEFFEKYRQMLSRDPFLPKEFSDIYRKRELAEVKILKLFELTNKSLGLRL